MKPSLKRRVWLRANGVYVLVRQAHMDAGLFG